MAANDGSTAYRNIPDVALTADNMFVVAGERRAGKCEGGYELRRASMGRLHRSGQ